MSNLPQIGPTETPVQTSSPTTVATSSEASVSNDDQPFAAKPFAPLIGFLDIGESELTNKNQTALNEIWDYLGRVSKSDLTSEKLHALQSLENRLAPPRIGQSRLTKVHGYVKAQYIVEQAEKFRDGHLRGIDYVGA